MKNSIANPFDDFTANGSPEEFYDCAIRAVGLLKPYLNDTDIHHQTLVAFVNSYTRLLYPEQDQVAENDSDEAFQKWVQDIVMRQRQIVNVFERIRNSIIAADAIAQVKSHSKAQSQRASMPRKLTEREYEQIRKYYWDSKRDGTSYGVVKQLAARFDVSPTTIQNIVKKDKP